MSQLPPSSSSSSDCSDTDDRTIAYSLSSSASASSPVLAASDDYGPPAGWSCDPYERYNHLLGPVHNGIPGRAAGPPSGAGKDRQRIILLAAAAYAKTITEPLGAITRSRQANSNNKQ